jgi:tRNA(fMet)-specific endonuclease VapC
MKLCMLDTNTVSYLIKGHPEAARHVVAAPMASLCVSAITEGELLFGLAKRPKAKRLELLVREFLRRVDVLAWENTAAESYGILRADLERLGKILGPLDLLIASHALSADAVLVTSDRSFEQVPGLLIENWTE